MTQNPMQTHNAVDLSRIAHQCEDYLNIYQDGALTDIRLCEGNYHDAPFFDKHHNSINFPLLMEVFSLWQEEGTISRRLRFYERGEEYRCFHQLGAGLLMWLFDQEMPSERKYTPLWHYGWVLLKINLHGNIAISIGEELLELHQASALVSYGKDTAINQLVAREAPETGISLLFNPDWLNKKLGAHQNRLAELLGEGKNTAESITQLLRIDGKLVDTVNQLLALDIGDPLYFLEVEVLTTNLLLQILKHIQVQLAEGHHHRLRELDIEKLTRVKTLLESDYNDQFSLEGLSREVGINRRKLTEGFKGLFGATVNEYLLRQRMINAADKLRQGLSATEVAHQVGYKEQSSFTRAFKRYYGILPRDFLSS